MSKFYRIKLNSDGYPDEAALNSHRELEYIRKAWILSRMNSVAYSTASTGCVLVLKRQIIGVGVTTSEFDALANAMRQIDAHDSDYPYVRAYVVATLKRTGSIVPVPTGILEGPMSIGTIYHT